MGRVRSSGEFGGTDHSAYGIADSGAIGGAGGGRKMMRKEVLKTARTTACEMGELMWASLKPTARKASMNITWNVFWMVVRTTGRDGVVGIEEEAAD